MKRLRASLGLALLVTACLGDPAGPGVLNIAVEGAGVDTVWVGAPGEPISTAIRLRITDDEGRPLAGASLEWEALGRDAQVLNAVQQSSSAGVATAGWLLGTDAAEEQQLQVNVRTSRRENRVVIRARAVPHVVSQLRVLVDTPAVLRLGDTLPVHVDAIDPYGNAFPAPDLAISVGDSAFGSVAGVGVIGGPRRGRSIVRVASHGVQAAFPLQVTQYVAAIVPSSDTLWFSALGAQRQVAYEVRDDRGRVVADTTATISVADPSVVQLEGDYTRAVAPGVTALRLSLGLAAATIIAGVEQRVGSLRLVRDTIRLDALLDTTTLQPIAHDSLGSPIPDPALAYDVSDPQVVQVAAVGTLEALKPGAATVTARDPATGISTSASVVVRQVIARIDVASPDISFDALGETLTMGAVAFDRLGSVVAGAPLHYGVGDSSVVAVEAGSRLRSIAPGQTVVVVTDPETGIVGTALVTVAQRATALRFATRSVSFDALGDTVPFVFSAWDRLGAPIANASATYQSSDPTVVSISEDGFASSRDNGSALVIAQSPDGPADTAQVTVSQRVAAMTLGRDTLAFESLQAVQAAGVTPVDRRGAAVRGAALTYVVEDTTVAAVDGAGQVRAVANGATRLLAVADGDTAVINLRIAQRAVRAVASPDTIRFDALGDVRTVSGVALDSLGSPVVDDVSGLIVADTTIVDAPDSVTLRARGNGVSTASLTVAGVPGDVVVVVDQVATSLTVGVAFAQPVVTLPVGATFPLACQASDRNGFVIAREPAFVGSVRGTVTGGGCADAVVQHSGYDTLSFAMGAAQARVPVIVATAPDSVGVLAAALPLTTVERERFVGEDLANPSILALRPLVQEILAEYGSPTSNLDRARALRDWVARTAVHPHAPLHPDGSTSNLAVLPPGKTWADVNALYYRTYPDSLFDANNAYWWGVGYDGYAMLDRLLGTLDPTTGLRADDGMMVHVTGARYQIRDLQSYRYPICTFQAIMLSTLWAAAGLHGMLISTLGHDPAAVFIPELGRWVYEDPTFNEEYLLDGSGDPLSADDLLTLTTMGQVSRLRAAKGIRPRFDTETYIDADSYITEHPEGIVIIGSQLNNRVVGIGGWPSRQVQIDVPRLAEYSPFNEPLAYPPVTAEVAFPTLGPIIEGIQVEDSVYVVHLSSTFPNHEHFERRLGAGTWEWVAAVDVLPVGQGRVEYRSVDAVGNFSAAAVLDVWLPRAEGFLESGVPGSVRTQALYYVSPAP